MTNKDTLKKEETFTEKSQSEEWGGWKFVSDMLDNPYENGMYPTSKCYEQLHDFVVAQKKKAVRETVKKIQAIADTTPPNLLLNEIINQIDYE